jgi:membrane-bound serine protease (ClpP class)
MTRRIAARTFLALRVAACALGLLGLVAAQGRAAVAGSVVVLPTSGVVDQVMAGYLTEGIQRAANDGAAAVVIQLDTPGGSLDSMATIYKAELNAPLPVIVWVGPAGARAASAGTFITLAAHLAAMAPATHIGAATPVGSGGEDIPGAEGQKVLNDAIKAITSIAEERGRPVDWAVSTVQDAKSYTVDEALAAGAIDIKAPSVAEVLAQADGRTISVQGTEVTLHTAGAPIQEVGMNPFQGFLHLLADPNIAFILFTVGFYGLLFELGHPNFVTGILGAFSIILAFIGFGSLPLNIAGLLLVGLAIVLFVLELTVVSHGLLTIAGLVAFVLGAAALYTTPGTPVGPDVAVAWPVIAVMTALTGVVVLIIVTVALRTRRLPPVNIGVVGEGTTLPPGTEGEVRQALAPIGTVYAAGEAWTARSANGLPIERGTRVRVVRQEGLLLIVEPVAAPWATRPPAINQPPATA